MYEEKEPEERLFLFNITMQNHSGYTMSWNGLPRTTWLTGKFEGKFSTVNQYLSLIYQSDQALEYLVDYFSQVEEPTLILLFGDHQPQVATNFYADVLGENPDLATAQKKQMVPFLLWANYDIPEAEGVELSLNYLSTLLMDTANLPMTGYQQFLKGLYEQMPVVNAMGLRDAAGVWYALEDPLPEALSAAVEEYKTLQYNNIFVKRIGWDISLPLTRERGVRLWIKFDRGAGAISRAANTGCSARPATQRPGSPWWSTRPSTGSRVFGCARRPCGTSGWSGTAMPAPALPMWGSKG